MKRTAAFILAFCLLFSCGMTCTQAADKVYALTMGVRRQDVNQTVSDGASVAVVTYKRMKDGTSGSANKIFDVEYGEVFYLQAQLIPGQENSYTFIGWCDGDGVLLSRELVLCIEIDSSKAVFAVYGEIAAHNLFTYTYQGKGRMSVSSDKPMQNGDGVASVPRGANVTVKFSPARKYMVAYIKLNGQKVFMTDNFMDSINAAARNGKIRDFFGAVWNYVKFLSGIDAEYLVENVTADTTFEVKFMKKAF